MKTIKFISTSTKNITHIELIGRIVKSLIGYCEVFEFYDTIYNPKYLYEDYKNKFPISSEMLE